MELVLVPGRDYPNTYRGFVEMFPDDTACAAFLVRLRFRHGILTNRLSVELNNLVNSAHFEQISCCITTGPMATIGVAIEM